jgi:hypothetical protein
MGVLVDPIAVYTSAIFLAPLFTIEPSREAIGKGKLGVNVEPLKYDGLRETPLMST